jgi:hypothetical protein
MAQAKVILDQSGPLPIEIKFKVAGALQVLFVSGSVWSKGANRTIGMDILIDNNEIGEAEIFANPAAQHMTVVPQYFVPNLKPGQYTLKLKTSDTNTQSDGNDLYRVLLLEF